MKRPQWITIGVAVIAIAAIFVFVRTVPKEKATQAEEVHSPDDGHDHGPAPAQPEQAVISIDSILTVAKNQLTPEQSTRLSLLESSITRGDVKDQQLKVYHQLSHFWGDSMGYFHPYAWYEAEAARLENSEKSLTFAARLFLDYLQQEPNAALRRWEAEQAKDLFERSLKVNPDNDSAKVGLGATYLFGGLSATPMEAIAKIREVAQRDSANVYAQLTLAKASVISGQLDKAIERLILADRVQPGNIETILMLADVYERQDKKAEAADWYEKSLPLVKRADMKGEIEKRISALRK
ncbi:MAG TPA: hypothetical protein PKC69_07715 [Chitinophagaceae bacterium]|nr:hypothetical protein [Chitinophagaceae bacterium]